jgi:hypothetical protein
MLVAERTGLAAGFAQQRAWTHNAASERRSHLKGRSEAQEPPAGRLDRDGSMWLPANERRTPLWPRVERFGQRCEMLTLRRANSSR